MSRICGRRRGVALLVGGIAFLAGGPAVVPAAAAAPPVAAVAPVDHRVCPPPDARGASPTPAGSAVPSGAADPTAPGRYEGERGGQVLPVLPLGAGLALVGLGLAALGWRLRR